MTDWKVGDLAVCVDDGRCGTCGCQTFDPKIAYEVSEVVPVGERVGLSFMAVVPCCPSDLWDASDFRKVQHDKPEACETAFTVLLNRSRRKVRA